MSNHCSFNNFPCQTNNKKTISAASNGGIDHQPRKSHGSSTAQACAACKHQRRKCAADCILAPYFPQDKQRQFLNAHRLFGVSNIVKIVSHLDPVAKDHAMRTIIYQSDVRAADPVGGCFRIIRDLEQQIINAEAELEMVLGHIALCRAAAGGHQQEPASDGTVTDGEYRFGSSACNERWRVEDANLYWDCMNENVHAEPSSFDNDDQVQRVRKHPADHHGSILDHMAVIGFE